LLVSRAEWNAAGTTGAGKSFVPTKIHEIGVWDGSLVIRPESQPNDTRRRKSSRTYRETDFSGTLEQEVPDCPRLDL
jgi:hypothetical protein